MRPHGSPEELQRRRERAVKLLRQGQAPVEVAHLVGVDRRSVRRWRAAFEQGGAESLRARPTPGRPSKLTAEQKQELEQALLEGAQAAGFPTDLWTCRRVGELIRLRFGVRYHVTHMARLLRSLGWSPQKPTRRAIERNEAAIHNWIKHDWPRIKKKPRG